MKNINTNYSLLILFLFIINCPVVRAQEKIKVKIDGYKYGTIQWQKSENGTTWNDIPGADEDFLEVNDKVPVFYRIKVTDGTCDPWYSSAFVTTFDEIEMVRIEGGTFTMGALENDNEAYDNEKNRHEVTLSTYYISKNLITNLQYADFLNVMNIQADGIYQTSDYGIQTLIYPHKHGVEFVENKWRATCGYEINPVVNVSWFGANEFCKWAGGRLATEAEWEFVSRGGKDENQDFIYSGSNTLSEVGWYNSNSESTTHMVGQKKANKAGVYDMSGNVWEWCQDWYESNYKTQPQTNPTGPQSCQYRIFRGGSSYTLPALNRNTLRYYGNPVHYYESLGFRLVKESL